jgi:hypothetical protein
MIHSLILLKSTIPIIKLWIVIEREIDPYYSLALKARVDGLVFSHAISSSS